MSRPAEPDQRREPATADAMEVRECPACCGGLMYRKVLPWLPRLLSMLLRRPTRVWKCHACGRSMDGE